MKKVNLKHLNTNVVIYLLVSFVLTLGFSVTGKYVNSGYDINIGSPSSETFYASSDIVNKKATDDAKELASNSISPLYTFNSEITSQVQNDINDFFVVTSEERTAYKEYLNTEPAPPAEGEPATEKEPFTSERLSQFLTDEEAAALLTLSDDAYNNFKESIINLFNSALEQGVKENSTASNIYNNETFISLSMDTTIQTIGKKLVGIFLRPNLLEDLESTEKARVEAQEAVDDIVVIKGQTIVSKGEIITEEDYLLLDNLGFVDSKLSENYGKIFGLSLVISLLFIGIAYFIYKCIDMDNANKKYKLLFAIYCISITLTNFTSEITILLSPVLLGVLIIGLFLDYQIALLYALVSVIVSAIITGSGLEFLLFCLISSIVLVSMSKSITIRKNVFPNSIIIVIINVLIYLALNFSFNNTNINLVPYIETTLLVSCVLIAGHSFIMYLLSFALIPVIEMTFEMLTPNKLIELSNPSNELLRKLTLETPGTYHHSLIVANLAEAAAYNIDADYSLARVGSYYHDIGKTVDPSLFGENQIGHNPHDTMTPLKSVEVIKNHVTAGIKIAKKYKLPDEIIDLIPQHHGNTLIRYFYEKEKEKNSDVQEKDFRYKGEIPQSKEAAIIMLADTCEAAVRSRISRTNSLIDLDKFIEELINHKLHDGQLVDSGLTIGDIEEIKKTFNHVFTGMYHKRVEYPNTDEEKKENADEEITEKSIHSTEDSNAENTAENSEGENKGKE
ncbi:MAG: HD family phosphohydrolase [Lachnospirales bacterium]